MKENPEKPKENLSKVKMTELPPELQAIRKKFEEFETPLNVRRMKKNLYAVKKDQEKGGGKSDI